MEITRVAPFLEYLDRVHERTRRVIVQIPAADLEWSPATNKFSFGDLVRHLATIERYMYAETVHGRRSAYPGHGCELAEGFDATLAFYDRLHAESRALFEELTDARLAEKCRTPADTPITVGKWLRAMIEHEVHHRGQIYAMLGILGVETPPLYGLTEPEVKARSLPAAAAGPTGA